MLKTTASFVAEMSVLCIFRKSKSLTETPKRWERIFARHKSYTQNITNNLNQILRNEKTEFIYWNLVEQNGNSNITCPLTLIITESQITENEFFGTDCAELDSTTDSSTFSDNTFTMQTDIGDFVFTVISLTEIQLEWETNDPNTNNVTNLKYDRIE